MCYDIALKCSNVHNIVDIPGDDINADILCEQKRNTMLVPVPNEHCERNPSDSSGWTYSGMMCSQLVSRNVSSDGFKIKV